ncbi:MAG TPA: 6-carboxytetrahydropterin synthase [Gemmatimonadales bacterium]|nr:6-carboxytetrahydropterin synthase [Gemmatimonadales bacterium]
MGTAYLTRVVEFTATHRLSRPDWTAQRNEETFGAAARAHSHRYHCRVTLRGPLRAESGGIMNLKELDALLAREVVARFDGRDLNQDLPEFATGTRLPTGEALAVYIWGRLADQLPSGVRLHTVRVQEGPDLYSEYYGEA